MRRDLLLLTALVAGCGGKSGASKDGGAADSSSGSETDASMVGSSGSSVSGSSTSGSGSGGSAGASAGSGSGSSIDCDDGGNGADADAQSGFVLPDASISGVIEHPCTLPGSVQWTCAGPKVVPGGPAGHDLTWMKLPTGFCSHYFGNVGNARQIRFAPGGELFVASPTGGTTGGGPNGQNAIIVLPDDNHDGVADAPVTFMSGLVFTQGLLFVPGYFYYQDTQELVPIIADIKRLPYVAGERTATGTPEVVANIANDAPQDTLHWPKPLDVADDGTIYVGNGGSQTDPCQQSFPYRGGILKLDPEADGGADRVAMGLRNPIAIRCSRGHDMCFALELALDYSAGQGGREKMIPIRQGDNWGFPCCASANLAYSGVYYAGTSTGPDCSQVAADTDSFFIGDTPFGIDFEPGNWPGMWGGRAFITTHGAAGSWTGARLVAIAMDPTTGLPVPGTNIAGNGDTGGMADFATGWDDGRNDHGRPAAVTFSPDGRLFLANDNTGDIVWIAPMSL